MFKTSVLALLLACCGQVAAQGADAFPGRQPIRLIVPSAPGSGADVLGRFLASRLGPVLKQSFVIENKVGATGAIGTVAVAQAPADGYTILQSSSSTMVLNVALNPKLTYDPLRDLVPIGQIGTSVIMLAASKDFPANSISDLVKMAKAPGASLQFASWGNGSSGHLCGEVLNRLAGVKMGHVPYKTTAQLITDLAAGHVKVGYVDMVTGTPFATSGQVKAIGMCPSRASNLPAVQSYNDLGAKQDFIFFWGLFAPAGTPRAIVTQLGEALKTVLAQPEVRAKLDDFGTKAEFLPSDEVTASMVRDIAFWKKLVQTENIRPE